MEQIIRGADISVYKTTAITIGVAKKENRNGVKSKFLILQAKDIESKIGKPSRIPLFEDDLEADIFDVLKQYRLMNDDGKPVVDERGGCPIDMKALRAAMKEDEDLNDMMSGYLRLNGGMVMEYDLGGAYYANDIDGNRTVDGRGNPVIKTSISVFVQVKNVMPNKEGGLIYNYISGMGLHERGSRMKAQFYREPVNAIQAPSENAGAKEEEKDPF